MQNKNVNDFPKQIKISNKTSDFICLIIAFLFVEISCIALMFFYEKFRLPGLVTCIVWACFMSVAYYSTKIFVVYIEGTVFRGKLDFGKKFNFECSDIKKITYKHYNGTYRSGQRTIVIIETDNFKLPLEGYMNGFRECVIYLLELQEKGIISWNSISAADKKELMRIAKGKK